MNVLDLFCGAGGLSCGFKQAGFNIVLGIDHDEKAIKTFKANHSDSEIICGDISKIKKEDILKKIKNQKIDIIIGGPPCQGFSRAGKRLPNDPRNLLVKQYLRMVSILKPKLFVLENVQGILSMKDEKGNKVIDIIKKISKNCGYHVKEYLLNAQDYGVPQKRKRVILIGSKEYQVDLRLEKKNKIPVKNILLKEEEVPSSYFYSKKRINGFKRRENINKKLKRGFGWQFLDLNKPSYTISARYYKDGAEALIKYSEDKIRMLTPKECALIQSFPRDYLFEGGKISVYRQIGNAVPPKLALEVAKSIKTLLSY